MNLIVKHEIDIFIIRVSKNNRLMQSAKFVCLEDFRKLAQGSMAPGDFNYLESGAE